MGVILYARSLYIVADMMIVELLIFVHISIIGKFTDVVPNLSSYM
jgi:hypothetical protein